MHRVGSPIASPKGKLINGYSNASSNTIGGILMDTPTRHE